MQMDISIATSVGALAVSIASLIVSIHFRLREEARLRTFSSFIAGDDEREPNIVVAAVNVGRRPMILRMLVGIDDHQEWAGTYLGSDYQGHRLGESERYEKRLNCSDLGLGLEDFEIDFVELYFEDGLGKRWKIDKSRENIEQFRSAYDRYGDAQKRKREMYNLVSNEVCAALRDVHT